MLIKRLFVKAKFQFCLNLLQKYSMNSRVEAKFSNGRSIFLSIGKYARFANSTVVCEMGDTSVMVTAVTSKQKSISAFTPLTVEYRLKSAAVGRIPTNFLRREMRYSEKEILCARLIDRSVRPLFTNDFRLETQIICSVLAMDNIFLPDILAINAVSAALTISDIPWNGPVGAVRVGFCDGEVIINPSRRELQTSVLDLIITATKNNLVVMIEGKADVVSINDMAKAIKVGTQQAQLIISAIENLHKTPIKQQLGDECIKLEKKVTYDVKLMSEMRLKEIFKDKSHDKTSRDIAIHEIKLDVLNKICSNYPNTEPVLIENEFTNICRTVFRKLIFEGIRCDGRSFDDLREISCEIDLYKPLHGSALFQRGQTQVFCTVSLDSLQSSLKLDSVSSIESGIKSKNFMLHYEFPPFATGEINRIGFIGRREIGHGALAEKALISVIPNNFPFTIRLTSEVFESNGSSSMASVCAGSLALMDAGVPVHTAAAGVAIGLVTKSESGNPKTIGDYRILTDILGIEDYMGDMDMKVAGTKSGFTAIQLDLKIDGVPVKVVVEALQKALQATVKILDIMNQCIRDYRKIRKPSWPVIENLKLEPHQSLLLFGQGGLYAKKLQTETDVQLIQNEGNNFILFAPSQTAMNNAKDIIEKLFEKSYELEFGGIYTAKIVDVKDAGVMVTLHPNMPPILLHNSQLDKKKISHASVLNLEVGQEIQVKYFGRDPVTGFMRISRKVLQSSTSPFVG